MRGNAPVTPGHVPTRRGSRGGGAGGARPPVFVPNSLKSALNWPKYAYKPASEPPAPPLFSNPGSAPAHHVHKNIKVD